MKKLLLIPCLAFASSVFAQTPTVGLFKNTAASYDGYTLFECYQGDTTYLIDNCGKQINKWSSHYRSNRNTTHLLPDGSILHAGKVTTEFASGAGLIERVAWNGTVLWNYRISDSNQVAHHTYIPLPNGNIIATVWEKKTVAEQLAAGRSASAAAGELWVDKLVELKPKGTDSAEIVWQWSLWDHLIQEVDVNQNNYGIINNHPELLNANVLSGATGSWAHINSVDYNPKLDQIMICSRNFDEVFVIDHSTTTIEAKSHAGGTYGKGGDFLYRWGNAANYNRGTIADKKLFHQHDAHWIPAGFPHAGDVLIFNNGITRAGSKYSTIVRFTPPQSNGVYSINTGQAYGPATEWIYPSTPDTTFYSSTQGSVQMMPNGNLLINEANSGDFQEIDSNLNLVWQYVSPLTPGGIDTQGNDRGDNGVFKMKRYFANNPAFTNQTLTAKTPIEINYYNYTCQTYPLVIADANPISGRLMIYPNPADDEVTIRIHDNKTAATQLALIDITGRTILSINMNKTPQDEYKLDVSNVPSGIYLIKITTNEESYVSRLNVR